MGMGEEHLRPFPNSGDWGWGRERSCLQGFFQAVEFPRW